jgi:uncharacterized protein YdbL (DUF1318 family)
MQQVAAIQLVSALSVHAMALVLDDARKGWKVGEEMDSRVVGARQGRKTLGVEVEAEAKARWWDLL